MLALPLGANALMNENEAQATVVSMLAEGNSAAEVIAALMADGRDLIDATIFALVAGGQENRVAFAEAGTAAAKSFEELQSVANALIATAGATGSVAQAVTLAVTEYKSTLTPPSTYQGGGIATGGDVSPST